MDQSPSQQEVVSVLYVDDEPGLLDLSKEFLEMDGEFAVTTCLGAREALELLEERDFDVIVSDYQMPRMDGIAFLKALRERDKDKPFIIFTGKGREEVLIEALECGADFYVQKGGSAVPQFRELASYIRYSFLRRRMEGVMKRQSQAIESSIDGISLLDGELRHVYTNRSYRDLFGHSSPEGLTGIHLSQLFEEDLDRILAGLVREPGGEMAFTGVAMGRRADGEKVPLTLGMQRFEDGSHSLLVRDISTLKEAEESIRRQAESIFAVDRVIDLGYRADDRMMLMSESLEYVLAFTGFDAGAVVVPEEGGESARICHQVGIPEEALSHMGSLDIREGPLSGVFRDGEILVPSEEGPLSHHRSMVFIPLRTKTEVVGAMGLVSREGRALGELETHTLRSIGREIGAALCRLDAEAEKEAARRNLETLFDNLSELVFIIEPDNRILAVNEAAGRYLGQDADGLVGRDIISLLLPGKGPRVSETMRRAEAGEEVFCETAILGSDGSMQPVETTIKPVLWNGELVRMVVARDVSHRKQYEKSLQDSERFSRQLMEAIPAYVLLFDDEGSLLYANGFAASNLGYAPHELLGMSITSIIAEGSDRCHLPPVDEMGQMNLEDLVFLRRDGERRILNASSSRTLHEGLPLTLMVLTDVTDFRRISDGWRRSDEIYTLISENTSDVIWLIGLDGRLEYVSPSSEKLVGFRPEEMVGRTVEEVVLPPGDGEARALLEIGLKRLRQGETITPRRLEMLHPHKEGGSVWVEAVVQSSLGPDGRPNGFMGITRGIDDRKRAEEALRESEEKHRSLVDRSHDIIYTLDLDGRVTFISEAWHRLTGHRAEDMVGREFSEFIHPDDLDAVLEAFHDGLFLGERQESVDYRVRHLDGGWRWHTSSGMPVHDEGGALTGMEGIARDVSSKKELERQARDREARFRALFTDSPAAIAVLDIETLEPLEANLATLEKYGVDSLEELRSMDPWMDPPYSEEDARAWMARAREGPQRFEWAHRRKDGGLHWEKGMLDIIRIDGEELGVFTSIDIDDLKSQEESLRIANRKLQLLSGVTRHDINNQLTALRGYLDLLREGGGPIGEEAIMERMLGSLEAMRLQIGFTKDYENLGSERPSWQEVSSILSELRPDGLTVDDRCAGLSLLGDPMLPRVFENLLDNSLRHGDGATLVRASFEIVGDECWLTWEDDGVGVPAGMKASIFERGVGSNTGLGLFLSREILDITGMRALEDGAPGEGARFRIVAPPGSWRLEGA